MGAIQIPPAGAPSRRNLNCTLVDCAPTGKITGTLSKGKFAKLLDKLEPVKGSTAVRFVEKG